MKKLSLLVLALANIGLLYAQTQPADSTQTEPFYLMSSSVRSWDEGPLTFSDFSTRTTEFPTISSLHYSYSWGPGREQVGNTLFVFQDSHTYMNPYSSWVHPNYLSPLVLLYQQTAFDYAEVCRRRAQQEYYDGSKYSLREIMDFHMGVADSFLAKMKEDTAQGQDSVALGYYTERVQKELAQTPAVSLTRDLVPQPKGGGLGIHLGIGADIYLGSVTDYITPLVGLGFGFDFTVRRVMIYWEGLVAGGGKYKKDIPLNGYSWSAGEHQSGGNMTLSVGYPVYESPWWKIVPFAGIGVGFLDYPYNPGDPKRKNDEISGFRYQVGLATDYKFFRTIDIEPLFKSVTEFSVRARIYAAHNNLRYLGPAWSINAGIDVGYMITTIKKKR